jgi:NADH-quinone oxidoreductase subunit N
MILILIFYFILVNSYNKIIELPLFEFIILILIASLALFIIMISNHLFLTFLFLEIINLCLYCLIGLNKNSNLGIEAAFKYFVQSSLATILGFFGISLIYLSSGSLFINELTILCSAEYSNYLTI